MKFTIAFLALFLSSFVGKAKAQLVPYDSLAVNSLYGGAGNVPDADNIEGPPDDAVVTLGSTSFISAQFFAGSQLVTLQKGAEMHVYWLRLNNTDSAAADIYFTELNDGVAERSTINPTRVMENTPTVNQLHETTIVVPDTGYNTLSITIGADTGASIAWLDAIILMQSGVAAVGEPSINVAPLLTSYPNPFEHGAMAKVEISAPTTGTGELVIFDALGREIERVPVGELNAGASEQSEIRLNRAGVYFARLQIDGVQVGAPLKLIAE